MSKSYHMWFLTSYQSRYNHGVNNCVLRNSFLFLSFYIYDGLHKYLTFECLQKDLNMETIITSLPNFLKHSLHYNMSLKKTFRTSKILKWKSIIILQNLSWIEVSFQIVMSYMYDFTHKVYYRYLSPNHEKSPLVVKVGFKN